MKSNMYKVCNNAERLRRGHHTLFLDNNEFNKVTSKLKKDEYKVSGVSRKHYRCPQTL